MMTRLMTKGVAFLVGVMAFAMPALAQSAAANAPRDLREIRESGVLKHLRRFPTPHSSPAAATA